MVFKTSFVKNTSGLHKPLYSWSLNETTELHVPDIWLGL